MRPKAHERRADAICPATTALLAAAAHDVCPAAIVVHVEHCRRCADLLEEVDQPSAAPATCDEAMLLESDPNPAHLSKADRVGLFLHFVECPDCREDALADLDPPPPVAALGERIAVVGRENYVERTEIARGGMGRVVLATDRRLGREVVLKEPLARSGASWADRKELHRRLLREAALTAGLNHPSIVAVHEVGRWATGVPFYAMQQVRGVPLDEAIAARSTLARRLELLENVLSTAEAIAYAHDEGVIHRDLKPHNVLVGDFGETVVIDWGLAKAVDGEIDTGDGSTSRPRVAGSSPHLTEAGAALGTPAYMSPEQALGAPADRRSDVFALGALLYHVLAGRPPYVDAGDASVMKRVAHEPPTALDALEPHTPPELVSIVTRAMAREPSDRYPNAGALAADLKQFRQGQLVATHDYSLAALVSRWIARHKAAVVVAAVAIVTLSLTIVTSVDRVHRQATRAERAAEEALAQAERAGRETARALAAEQRAAREASEAHAARERALAAAEQAHAAERRALEEAERARRAEGQALEVAKKLGLANDELHAQRGRLLEQRQSLDTANGRLADTLAKERRRAARLEELLGPTSTALR